MSAKNISRTFGVAVVFAASVFLYASPVSASVNILTNPGAEDDGTGWNTILNGGDGMSYDFDGIVRSGSKSFQTSHGLDSISQKVDLFANGYSASDINAAPSIRFGVWLRTRGDQAGQYYVRFSLLQQDGTTVVATENFGDAGSLIEIPSGTDWTEISHTFSGYGSGVRYAYIEFGGQDQSGWAGNYGTHFDDASIVVSSIPVTGGGGSAMPWWGYVPPVGPFRIAVQGGASTNATDVMLDISASSDVDRMVFSRRADFSGSGIVPFASSFPWSVCGAPTCEAGTYDVYAKFYQPYGMSSPVQHLAITYAPLADVPTDVRAAAESVADPSSMTAAAPTLDPAMNLFERNLRRGDRGADVKRLQEFLNGHGSILAEKGPGSPGQETDVFGPALKAALVRFQEANVARLLMPLGLKKGTGVFGTQTRTLVNELLLAHEPIR